MSETVKTENNANANQNSNQNSSRDQQSGQNQKNAPQNQNPKKRKINSHSNRDYGQGSGGGQQQSWTRLTGAPAWDLPPNDTHNQTFTGRCRLFVANLPQNVTEDSLRGLFGEFGKISDIYIGKGNQFAFVKMDTRANAENAKQQLDGRQMEGRTLRVRLAAHAAAIRVSQLPPLVTNELLHLAFSSFGAVERAIVSADDRGRSLNEGIVEFARKSSSQAAIKKCQNECLLLSTTPIPVVVTPLESRDEEEGVPEKSVIHSADYRAEREIGPRFAEPGTFEWEMARKWKQLSQIESQRREQLEQEFKELRDGLKQQMDYLRIEETTKQLREQLRQMENESQKLQMEREQRLEMERRREEQRRQTELALRQQEEHLLRRSGQPGSGEDLGSLRRQESELRQQANALQQLLDRQEQALRSMGSHSDLGQVGHQLLNHSALPPQMEPQLHSNHTLFSGNSAQIHPQLNPQALNPQIQQNPNQFGAGLAINPNPNQMRAHSGPPPPPVAQQHYGGGGIGGRAQGMGLNHNYKRNRRF